MRRKPHAAEHSQAEGWGETFTPQALHYVDYSDASPYAQSSASVIDGSIVEDTDHTHRIIMLIDLWPWNGGVFAHLNVDSDGSVHGGRANALPLGDGYATINGRTMLLLSDKNSVGDADGKHGNINQNTDRSAFTYVADVNGPRDSSGRTIIYALKGTPQPYTVHGVDDSNLSIGKPTSYSLSSTFELYKNNAPLMARQEDTGTPIPMNIFYKSSELQVFNTQHVLQVFSDDDGQTWHTDRLVTPEFRSPDSHYALISPGASIHISEGTYAGRLVVPVYTQRDDGHGGTSVKAHFLLSDDGGTSWHHGGDVPTSRNLHESAVVDVHGVLVAFHRHSSSSGGKMLLSFSSDGGMTWSEPVSALGDDLAGVGSQISALALTTTARSPETGEMLPAIVVTSADTPARTHGIMHYGVVHENPPRVEWIQHQDITDANTLFAYSSMAMINDGRLGILYETSPDSRWGTGLQAMHYREITI